ncbi:MAG: hypothetical protein WBD05_08420 [Phycisphaerae bacterium]
MEISAEKISKPQGSPGKQSTVLEDGAMKVRGVERGGTKIGLALEPNAAKSSETLDGGACKYCLPLENGAIKISRPREGSVQKESILLEPAPVKRNAPLEGGVGKPSRPLKRHITETMKRILTRRKMPAGEVWGRFPCLSPRLVPDQAGRLFRLPVFRRVVKAKAFGVFRPGRIRAIF